MPPRPLSTCLTTGPSFEPSSHGAKLSVALILEIWSRRRSILSLRGSLPFPVLSCFPIIILDAGRTELIRIPYAFYGLSIVAFSNTFFSLPPGCWLDFSPVFRVDRRRRLATVSKDCALPRRFAVRLRACSSLCAFSMLHPSHVRPV